MTRQLNNHGFEVITAADGDSAIDQLQHKLIDLILMDIQMPGKDGLTTIREIRDVECHSQLPIIGFTASADRLTHQRIIAAGAQRVLTKPISEIDLVTAICYTLGEAIAC
ncbi:MAG: response regulator [Gammaproteobacteria bacterium]